MNEFNNDFYNEIPSPEPKNIDLKTAKKTFSAIGFALCAILAVVYAIQIGVGVVIGIIGDTDSWLITSSWRIWILSFVPLYAFAIPAGILLMKKLPAKAPERHTMSKKSLLIALPITFFLMTVGNYLGNFLSIYLSKGTAENAVATLAMDTNPIKILVMVILAPLIEEYVFRKQIIDRTLVYGEKTAVLLSGLLFGLFHMNLFQFFYAFFIGLLLAYIYVRTGKLRYSIIIHCIINFFGSVVASFVISKLDLEIIEKISSLDPTAAIPDELMQSIMNALPGMLLYIGYSLLLSGFALAGLILMILKRKNIIWKKTELELPKESSANIVFMNIGIVLFIVMSVTLMMIGLFPSA